MSLACIGTDPEHTKSHGVIHFNQLIAVDDNSLRCVTREAHNIDTVKLVGQPHYNYKRDNNDSV